MAQFSAVYTDNNNILLLKIHKILINNKLCIIINNT